jgi:hypothetical protein
MLDNLQLFRLASFYLTGIGIFLGSVNFLLCILLHAIHWNQRVARYITGILTFLAMISITLALTGIGAWVWTDGLEISALSEMPQWSLDLLNMLVLL